MISCIIITAFSIGTVMNTRPVIFAALAEENNFKPGQMAVCYTVTLISSALSVSPIAKIYNGKTAKKVLLILGIFVCISMALGRIFSSLWRWYFLCVFMGIGSGSIMMLLCVTLNCRFAEKSPGIIGIVTASGGGAGILVNPICSYMVKIISRKKTAVIFSAISLSVYLFALVFMFAPSETQREKPEYSPDKAEFKNIKFITALLGILLLTASSPVANQLAVYAKDLDFGSGAAGFAVSRSMAGNVAGKLACGAAAKKAGIFKTAQGFCVTIGLSLILFFFADANIAVFYFASFILGTSFAASVSLPPILFRKIYGREKYKPFLAKSQMYYNFSTAALSRGIPAFYDIFGTYKPIFTLGIGTCLFASLLFHKSEKDTNKNPRQIKLHPKS